MLTDILNSTGLEHFSDGELEADKIFKSHSCIKQKGICHFQKWVRKYIFFYSMKFGNKKFFPQKYRKPYFRACKTAVQAILNKIFFYNLG